MFLLNYHFPYLYVGGQKFEHLLYFLKSPFQSSPQMLLSVPIVVSILYKEEVEEALLHGAALVSWYAKSLIAAALVKMLSSEILDVTVNLTETSFCWLWYPEDLLCVVPVSHEACKALFSDKTK